MRIAATTSLAKFGSDLAGDFVDASRAVMRRADEAEAGLEREHGK